jgi:Cu-Zn family superoxide dismutase
VDFNVWILFSEKGQTMKRLRWFAAAVLVTAVSSAIAYAHQKAAEKAKAPTAVTRAVCALNALGDSKVTGTVTFTQGDGYVEIQADVSGLTPGKHGFHVHEFGDCVGRRHEHGRTFQPHRNAAPLDSEKRHAGDMKPRPMPAARRRSNRDKQ